MMVDGMEDEEPQPTTSTEQPAAKRTGLQAPRFSINDDSKPVPIHIIGLIKRRWILTLASTIFAVSGIVLTIVSVSLNRAGYYTLSSGTFRSLKFLGMILTLFLVGCIIAYHIFDSQLHLLLHGYLGLKRPIVTWQRLVQVAIEGIICCLIPLPLLHVYPSTQMKADSFLAPLVLLRLYMLPRAIQILSFGLVIRPQQLINPKEFPLSRYELDSCFHTKICFLRYPFVCFTIGSLIIFFSTSWSMYLAEHEHGRLFFLDSLYFTIVTLTTVGYGDITPYTPHGKIIAGIIAILGNAMIGVFVWIVFHKMRISNKDHEAFQEIRKKKGISFNEDEVRVDLQQLHQKCDMIINMIQKDSTAVDVGENV